MKAIRVPLIGFALTTPVLAVPQATPVIVEGDSVPGVGIVTSIGNLAIENDGSTLIEVDTDNPDTTIDSALLQGGVVVAREGEALSAPAGAAIGSFDSVTLDTAGNGGYNFFLDNLTTSTDSGVFFNKTLVVQESDLSAATGFSAGTTYIGFFDVKICPSGDLFVVASMDDPVIASTVDRALMQLDLDASGGLLSETVLFKEGDILPGQTTPVTDFGTGPHETAINASFQVLFAVDVATGGTGTSAIYLDSTLLAQAGAASPVAGRNWLSLTSTSLDLNDAGETVFRGNLDGDTATNSVLIKNGALFRQEGDSLPAIAPFTFTSFGSGPVKIGNTSDVLWYGDWNDSDTDVDTGLFLNDDLIVQEGVTVIDGSVVDTLRGVSDGFTMSRDGRKVLFEAILADGREGAFLIDFGGLTTTYCVAVPNSSGLGSMISGVGSTNVADQDVTLRANQLPAPNTPGIFYFGPNQIQVAFGDGFRCVGGMTRRIQPPAFADGTLTASRMLDFNAVYAQDIVASATLNFQFWYRDPMAMMAGFNLSDGLSVTFQ